MSRIAVFPGSFDPITVGHVDIIERAVPLFDSIVIGIGDNFQKKFMFDAARRKKWIEKIFSKNKNISVKVYRGLTVDFCKQNKADYLLRGLRSSADFEYERFIAQANYSMTGIETIFLLSKPEYSAISSTVIRDILTHGGDAKKFIPKPIENDMSK